jgi:predicted Rossmann-fold nucleotide-binding protein
LVHVACPGGTGTLAELAVVWEMLNKGVMVAKPLVVLGKFWQPIIERVRRVELGDRSPWRERGEPLVGRASSPTDAARYLRAHLKGRAAKRRPARRSGERSVRP